MYGVYPPKQIQKVNQVCTKERIASQKWLKKNTMKTKIAGMQDWVSGNLMKEREKDRERK